MEKQPLLLLITIILAAEAFLEKTTASHPSPMRLWSPAFSCHGGQILMSLDPSCTVPVFFLFCNYLYLPGHGK